MNFNGKSLVVVTLSLCMIACSSSPYVKRSEHSDLYSHAMGRYMSYSVYTPPNWQPSESLPLMVLLHGARDNHETFDRYAVGELLDKEISQGNAPRVVILSPEGELGFWENWHDGSKKYRDWVVKDLIPHVQKRYATLPCPDSCFVSGISMGGHGALRFAYYEPETFSSVAAISAPIISKLHPTEPSIGQKIFQWFIPTERIWGDLDGENSDLPKDIDPFISWVEREDLKAMPLLLTWGAREGDSIKESNTAFHQHLQEHGKAHAWLVFDGAHKWVDWRVIMSKVLNFHMLAVSDKLSVQSSQKALGDIEFTPEDNTN